MIYLLVEYYSAIKNDVLMHATTWISFENIMLTESETQKAIYHMKQFI